MEFLTKNQIPESEKPKEIKFRIPNEIDYKLSVWMKNNKYSLKTIKEYCIYIKEMVGKRDYISELKIKNYLSKKNNTVKSSAVKILLVYLEDMYSIRLPEFRFPRLTHEKKPINIISREDFDLIYKAIEPRFKIFLKIMYFGGLRATEVVKLQSDDFDWNIWLRDVTKHCNLIIKKGKGNRDRLIPLSPFLMENILRYVINLSPNKRLERDIRLFDLGIIKYDKYVKKKKKDGVPLDAIEMRFNHKVYRFFVTCLHEASLKAIGKKIKSHTLRSSRATHLDAAGVQTTTIQRLLGHDNLVTTSRYIYKTPEKVKEELSKFDDY